MASATSYKWDSAGRRTREYAYYYNEDGQRELRVDNRRRYWKYGYVDQGHLTTAEQNF